MENEDNLVRERSSGSETNSDVEDVLDPVIGNEVGVSSSLEKGSIEGRSLEEMSLGEGGAPWLRVVLILLLVAATVLALVYGARSVAGRFETSETVEVVSGNAVEVVIEVGSSATEIYELLNDLGVVPSSELKEVVSAAGLEDRLQAGSYLLTTGMGAEEVLKRLVEGGEVVSSEMFTVIEGWTIDRIIDELSDVTPYTRAEYQKALRDDAVTSPLLPENVSDPLARWEGLLYPAKYPIVEGTSPAQILQMMSDEMYRRFEDVDWSRIGELDISRYEVLIIGSLIEWEAGTESDKRIISSVVHNRLGIEMRLQIDATVIYALGYNPGRVLAVHLEVDSPYNTYKIDGLPPTPIGAVSEASLEAAADPVRSEYLFYVLGAADGSHVFAETYEEHKENIARAREEGILP